MDFLKSPWVLWIPLQSCVFQSTGFPQDWDSCGLRQDSSPVQSQNIVWVTIQINWDWSPLESSGFMWGTVKTSAKSCSHCKIGVFQELWWITECDMTSCSHSVTGDCTTLLTDIKDTSIGPVSYLPNWKQPYRQPEWAGTPAHCKKQWPGSIIWLLTSIFLSAEVFFLDVDAFSKGKVQGWHTTSISSQLEFLLSLGHLGLEIFVKLA